MATFLLEVGTEDLPANFVGDARSQWLSYIPKSLADSLLEPQTIQVYTTPRRLAVLITGLPLQQPDQEEEVKGPPVQTAFKDGQPTKAAIGFAQKQGVEVSALEIKATDKGEFVFARKRILGQSIADLLIALVPQWIHHLEGKRFMRWGDGTFRFSRPIRWLVALLDEAILPICLESGSEQICSDRISWGHRVLHPDPISLIHANDYLKAMQEAFVLVDPDDRRQRIVQQAKIVAESVGGNASISSDLLEEVTNLVEYPTAVVGNFDPGFLELPSEVIITEMESHQRYFPVLAQKSQPGSGLALLPYFITIANGDPEKSTIIARGNERVIRARLSDGKFFYDADRAIPLEAYLPRLETVTFQEDLGSMRAKVERIGQIAALIAEQLQLSPEQQDLVQRSALLCKADLVTQMVGEFPELQGIMGQKYALHSGESPEVATAILEHYLPRGATDQLPQTLIGQVVGLADRLDTLVSIFSLGMVPTGSSDPFALRRAAIAIINIIWSASLPLNLKQLLQQQWQQATASHPGKSVTLTLTTLEDFFLQRLRSLLQEDRGVDYDLVHAVLGDNDPSYASRALQDVVNLRDRAIFLQTIRNNGTLSKIYETVNRASRLAIQGDLDKEQIDPTAIVATDLFEQPSERAFYDGLIQLLPRVKLAQTTQDYQALMTGLIEIAPIVANFFDGPDSVLVMAENAAVRRNRLNLLGLLRNHARILGDFGAIVKS